MEQKNSLQGVLSLFLLVVTILLVYSVFWGPLSKIGGTYPSRTVMVQASGKVMAKPDVALISFSIVHEGSNTQVITDENNKRASVITSYLKEQGIDEKDIRTSEYALSPVYSQPTSFGGGVFVPSIVKYTLTQTFQVKVRDFSKVSPLMSELVSLGVNRLNSISFAIDDEERFKVDARAEAFSKAKEKARIMAEQAGIRLGKIVSVNEYGSSPISYKGMGGEMAMSARDFSSIAPASIEPGSNEIEVTVDIVYEIR